MEVHYFADDFVEGIELEMRVSGLLSATYRREGFDESEEKMECTYLFSKIVTASLPQVSVAWSPETVVMVPSMRTVLVEGLAEGAKACRWEGRMRGVVMEFMVVGRHRM